MQYVVRRCLLVSDRRQSFPDRSYSKPQGFLIYLMSGSLNRKTISATETSISKMWFVMTFHMGFEIDIFQAMRETDKLIIFRRFDFI